MAKKITDLPALTVADDTDLFPIVDISGNVTKKVARTGLVPDGSITAIKTSFGGNYSASEVATGFTWIDGRPIYKKTISVGSLPNTTTKTVAHGITGLDFVIDAYGFAYDGTVTLPLPYPNPGGTATQITLNRSGSDLGVQTGTNRTSYTGYVTWEYVKTA